MTDQPKTEAPGVEGSPQGEGARQDALRGRPSPPESVELENIVWGAMADAIRAIRTALQQRNEWRRAHTHDREVWKRAVEKLEAERDRLREDNERLRSIIDGGLDAK